MKTPASLLERLKRLEDREAWERFVRLYAPLMSRWAQGLGLSESAASDLVQDVFLVLVQKLPEFQYDRSGCFRAWLKTVTLNKWRERHRRERLEPTCPGEICLPEAQAPDGVKALEEADDRRLLVLRAMEMVRGDFEELTWNAWREHVGRGRAAKEVAAELGMSPNAVYLAKARVLRRLRQELEGLLD